MKALRGKTWVRRHNPHLEKGEVEFFNRKNESVIHIFDLSKQTWAKKKGWQVYIGDTDVSRDFTTKSQAMRFAADYKKGRRE